MARQELLGVLRGRDTPGLAGQTIPMLFREQALRTPDAIALDAADGVLTYAELAGRANRLARELAAQGVGPDVLVAIWAERGLSQIVGLLAILEAGGAYLPLDTGYPAERLALMLDDARPRVILVERGRPAPPLDGVPPVVDLDPEPAGAPALRALTAPAPDNLAYVSYTSGSTGVPKGVAATHAGAVRLVRAPDYVVLDPSHAMLQYAPIGFDASTLEVWGALLNGLRLVIAPPELQSLDALADLIRRKSVTTVFLTAPLFHLLVDRSPDCLRGVRQVLTGGDVVSPAHVRRALAVHDRLVVVNCYGPTETTTFASCHPMRGSVDAARPLPIGRPIPDTRLVVVDERLDPAPAGAIGELCIGGAGVARGYLNRPALTAERFVPDPTGAEPGGRVYRTGDLVRVRDDGTLEFLGRADRQVKIRGFRVEPAEVEAALTGHEAVREAVVVPFQRGHGRALVAYVVVEPPFASGLALRAFLAGRLPPHLVPSAFVLMESLPLDANGKIDRRALPEPAWEGDRAAEAPLEGKLEELVGDIWRHVLKRRTLGAEDDFLEAGGDSLAAVMVVARIRDALQIDLAPGAVFAAPTVRRFAAQLTGAASATERIAPRVGSGPAPASPAQERLWLIDQLAPGNVAYNIHEAVRLRGPLQIEALGRALDAIVTRHESLRTTFRRKGDELLLHVAAPAPLALRVLDMTGASELDVRRRAEEEARTPFDLQRGPLFRAQLARLGIDDHLLLTTMHHSISDGWSLRAFHAELSELYGALTSGRPPALPNLPIQFPDYAAWERRWLEGEAVRRQVTEWIERLRGHPVVLELPQDRRRPTARPFEGSRAWFDFDAEEAETLRALARSEGVTLFSVLFAAFAVLLHRYGTGDRFIVGTPVATRDRTDVEHLIGFFVNTLPVGVDCSGDPPFRELLHRLHRTLVDANAHRHVPFERLVEKLQPDRDMRQMPLVQVMFSYQVPDTEALSLPGMEVEHLQVDNGSAPFDLAISLEERGAALAGWLTYSTAHFDAEVATRLVRHLSTLLGDIAKRPERRLSMLDILPAEERETLLTTWTRTEAPFERAALIQDLVDAQAQRTPDALAVASPSGSVTFAELVTRANRWAQLLRGRGVGPETLVALLTERSIEMAIVHLGVLKAGGAVVPLDPGFPPDRLALILQDTGARLVLAEPGVAARLPSADIEVLLVSPDSPELASQPDSAPPALAVAANLAQVYYTSGSTGTPKGILLSHEGWPNIIAWHGRYFGLRPGDRAAQFGAVAFDACAWELWTNLAVGASVHIMDEETRMSAEAALAWMADERITGTWLPAVLAEAVLDLPFPPELRLRWLASGGDRLRYRPGRTLPFTFYNMYGPTEITIMRTCGPVADSAGSLPPIGHPIANSELYVLDRHANPVPIGVPGELYIGGVGLARGYLGRPGQTAERFVPNPFSSEPGSRLYRTGDVVRFLDDGAIDFIGRTDHQVKVRGFRVELGEIEAVLARHPRVAECAVITRPGPNHAPRVVAYAVTSASSSELGEELARQLPDYMVPSAFVILDAMPVNAFGKVDRLALPDPADVAERATTEPRTETERVLAAIWGDVLESETIGVDDDFFKSGGTSVLATKVAARIRAALGRPMPLRRLYEHSSIARLAAWLDANPAG